jgi:hypothetical protein
LKRLLNIGIIKIIRLKNLFVLSVEIWRMSALLQTGKESSPNKNATKICEGDVGGRTLAQLKIDYSVQRTKHFRDFVFSLKS